MTIPNPESWTNDPAFPDVVDDAAPERDRLVDPEEPALPGDRYLGVDAVGTTVEEQIEGESLEQKLAREVPDTIAEPRDDLPREADGLVDESGDPDVLSATDQPAGRLVEPDEGASTDDEPDLVASASLHGETDFSPEEAAMHIREA
ncbi:hypothetical protein EV189_1468 [Motilibacter rhizosphaerae]|uniref:DUF5709 domain-containing protein n=1 Tax=Motilibacter rhizosphaerae TaxID=598652 RepID=A0A4Q7NRT1_9ACTN|nr:DUF5709 domain-containing protein [Motilibacter rhizosphaerae]RZS89695.1 hypothetical protein EV189_1468 [Motilibacter rhizosphaerae]